MKILDTVGAIVEISKGKEGMIHISKFGIKERIADVNSVAKVGEIVKVKVYSVDKEKGRIGLEKIVAPASNPAPASNESVETVSWEG